MDPYALATHALPLDPVSLATPGGDRGCAVLPGQLTGQQLPEPVRGPGAGDPDLSRVEVWTQVHQREPSDAEGWEP